MHKIDKIGSLERSREWTAGTSESVHVITRMVRHNGNKAMNIGEEFGQE
eukprot:CAMPEP_0170359808 /NCGR_PEP_ID=MMETSP0117_2-20130122/2948_1 /TAXON_ID=400756 /ORGANISM="Durinskia baltica, Strain CSIRO CS-38" /LENGTH=48 /DNA_ID= /DNA_START= /DNA_END= /DNA_ORIENTATION=